MELFDVSIDSEVSDDNQQETLFDDTGAAISTESDIVFACPHCDHQLVIDIRGAGLTVNCTECSEPVQVPIPEGMEMSDFDDSAEQLFVQVMQLRRALARADERIAELEQSNAALIERRTTMESARQQTVARSSEINGLLTGFSQKQVEISEIVEQISALLDEEQK